jgi:RecB family exonuclease
MLMKYEACPMRVKLQYIEHMPEPPRPPDNPMERGNREHKRLERYVKGETNSLANAEAKFTQDFLPLLDHARELHTIDQATTEQDWFFDAAWNACEKQDRHQWSKIDLSVFSEADGRVVSIDYKTGKSQYKTVEHIQQNQLYAAHTACRYPWADRIDTELWYLDEGHIRSSSYSREEALKFVGRFEKRAERIFADKFFRPNPNIQTCRWCPYGPRGTGVCPVGV